MSRFVDNILELIKDRGITKSKLLSDLGLNRNSLVDWNKRGTIPNADTVSAIAEYLEVPVGYLLGFSTNEEKLSAFNEKLALQMAYKDISLSELSEKIGVSVDKIFSWLKGEADCPEYYDRLAEIFEVAPTYWVRPGMVSPGIEPTLDEYLLIILYREYWRTGELQEDLYGSLRHYFPTVFSSSQTDPPGIDPQLLQLIRQLDREQQIELRGYIKGMLGRSVAADPSGAPAKMAK